LTIGARAPLPNAMVYSLGENVRPAGIFACPFGRDL
jgi:hypothetical protein